MKLDQLRRMALFALVAKEGSFTAVSKQQDIATSAISSAISQLESEIGTRLFHRSTRKLRLTTQGEVFLKRCQAMLHEAQTAHEELNQLTGQLVGSLTITASQWEAQTLVLPALRPLLAQNPQLLLQIVVNDEQLDLVEHGIDIAIRAGQLKNDNLVARALCTVPEVVVASASYLQTQGLPTQANDLASHRIIAFTPFIKPQQLRLLDAKGVPHTVELRVGAQTNQMHVMKDMCLMGLGLARLPFTFVAQELQTRQLLALLPHYTLPEIHLYAVTTHRTLQSAKVNAAIRAIQLFSKPAKPTDIASRHGHHRVEM